MAWHRVLLTALAALAASKTCAQACPNGQFPVSVLDNAQVQCLASRPCSGVYGPQGLLTGVGACPSGTGCALLPHNPSVMGCVVEGRGDVSYVNPDGSLSLGGKVISGPPTTTPTTDANSGSSTTALVPGSNTNTDGSGGANANANANNTASATPTPTTNEPTPAQVKPGGDASSSTDDATKAPSTESSSSGKTTLKPTTTSSSGGSGKQENSVATTAPSTPQANQQNALDDINGDIASNSRGVNGADGLGLGSIIAIVVACLAVLAVIAGVFVLRKKKEQSAETPMGGAVDDYGAACVTPKENVLLL